ncbi:MAG TPA: serine/threonine-protein kinase [Kofleriaceae bacterium]|nr:serine/threonine-protein kinase [Kofleriaceae bacterium]
MYGVGTILAGKYRIERMIGEGGMGMVVAATHLHLGTQVALKFLHHDMASNAHMSERFMREARASALLKSEHVCRVADVGILETGAPYIVMELLAGQDLSSMLRNHGPLPVSTVADYVLQALIGLAEAHAAGIVHRDLKPGNLFWTQRPDGSALIKVLDFGIAKSPASVNFSMTHTSAVMGSPGYMSPEQLKSSKVVDARSDVWSMGVVLYELVTGNTPFHGESITELALKVAMDPTPELPGHFPRTFQALVARCLEKDPARRFPDVADLAQALAPFAGPRGQDMANGVTRVLRGHNAVAATMHAVGAMGPHGAASGARSNPPKSHPTTLGAAAGSLVDPNARGRGALIGAVAALSVIGIVIGVVLAMRGDGKSSATASPPTTAKQPDTAKVSPPPPPIVIDAGVAPVTPDAEIATTTPPAIDAGADEPPQVVKKKTTRRSVKKRTQDVGDSRD